MSKEPKRFYEFDSFRLDPEEKVLFRDGQLLPLSPKLFDTLLVLVEGSGHIVEKEALIKRVWPDTFVEENNLAHNISVLRRALGGGSNGERYIETVPRRGYRFKATVTELGNDGAEVVVARHSSESLVIKTHEVSYVETEDGKTIAGAIARPVEWVRKNPIRSLGAIAFASILVVSIVLLTGNRSKSIGTGAPIKSIAVLPFKNLSGDETNEYLGIALADALTTRLGKSKHIIVRPTNAVYKYRSVGQDPIAAGREQGVEAVLDGTIYKSGDRIRVTIQLVRTIEGATIWSDAFDAHFQNVLAAQDSLSSRVVEALRLNLNNEEIERLALRHSKNPEAYKAYLMGRYFWNRRTPDGNKKARQYFEQAISLDPNYALGYAGLAGVLSMMGTDSTTEQRERLATRALEIDDTLAEAHAILGFINLFVRHNWRGAEQELKRAIELDPNYATAHQWYSIYLETQGRLDEAETEMRRALEIDPLSLGINADLGELLYFKRDYDSALEQCLKTLEMDPTFGFVHAYLEKIYTQKGMYAEAADHLFKRIEFFKHPVFDAAALASMRQAFKKAGIKGLWRAYVYEALRSSSPVDLNHHARYHALLGETDRALDYLEKEKFHIVFVNAEPAYDNLRSSPQFGKLLTRLGLAD